MRTLSESLVGVLSWIEHFGGISPSYPFFFSSDSVRLECSAEDKADVKLNKTKVGSRVRIFAAVCTRFLCFTFCNQANLTKKTSYSSEPKRLSLKYITKIYFIPHS